MSLVGVWVATALVKLECTQYFSNCLPFSFDPEAMHLAVTLPELFALDAWMLADWITFGAVQSARALTVDIVFLVIVLRRRDRVQLHRFN